MTIDSRAESVGGADRRGVRRGHLDALWLVTAVAAVALTVALAACSGKRGDEGEAVDRGAPQGSGLVGEGGRGGLRSPAIPPEPDAGVSRFGPEEEEAATFDSTVERGFARISVAGQDYEITLARSCRIYLGPEPGITLHGWSSEDDVELEAAFFGDHVYLMVHERRAGVRWQVDELQSGAAVLGLELELTGPWVRATVRFHDADTGRTADGDLEALCA